MCSLYSWSCFQLSKLGHYVLTLDIPFNIAPRTAHTYHQEVIRVRLQCSVQHMRTWKLHRSRMCSWQSPRLPDFHVLQFWLRFNLSWFLLSKSIGLFPLYLSTSTCLSLARVETGLSMKPNTHQNLLIDSHLGIATWNGKSKWLANATANA